MRRGKVFKHGESQGFLMSFRQKLPSTAQINEVIDQFGVRGVESIRCCFSQPNTLRLSSQISTVSVQEEIPCNSEKPGPGVTFIRWSFREAFPDDEKRLCDHVLSTCWFRPSLNKPQKVRICSFV